MKKNISMKVVAYTFLIVMAIIFIMPMLFTIISSLKTKLDIFSDPFALPKNPQWKNYVIAWKDANMSAYFINSVILYSHFNNPYFNHGGICTCEI